jgi:hypothetical protein
MEVKGQPGAAPTASPVLSSQYAYPFCVFLVSPPPYHEIAQGISFIIGFRSRRSLQQWDPRGRRLVPPLGQLLAAH